MMLFDYETLRLIWWAFSGLIIIIFALTCGFDLGIGMLLLFLGKNDEERQLIIHAIEPTWYGNQVWFTLSASILFAVWPIVFAVSLQCLYLVLLLLLCALFLRPLGFAYRSKLSRKRWRTSWDWVLFLASVTSAFICGIIFGNLLVGLPFYIENDMRIIYSGDFLALFNPFSLLAGFISLCMFIAHGAAYMQIKTVGRINKRAKQLTAIFTFLTLTLFAWAGDWVFSIEGYHITSGVFPNAISNPIEKTVKQGAGLWLDNYGHQPSLWALPASAFIAGFFTIFMTKTNRSDRAFMSSCMTIAAIILIAGGSMFPFIIPSSISLSSSLTIWDSSASLATLHFMFWVTVILLPIILIYTRWVFRVIKGKTVEEHTRKNNPVLYRKR